MTSLDLTAPTYIAGHRGLVGGAVWRHFAASGFTALMGRTSGELDLRDRAATFDFFAAARPRYVVMAAAKVGGIMANSTYPADFLSDNLRIQVNVLDAALSVGVERLLFLGSSCIYPKFAPQPISEDALLDRPARADERRVRDREDRRCDAGAGDAPPARCALDLGDADEPLRAGRQLRSADVARAAGADPALPRGEGELALRRCRCGAPARRAASSCTSTIWPGRVSWCSTATTTRRRSTSASGMTSRLPSSPSSSPASSATPASGCSTRANPTARRASCSTCAASTRSDSRRRFGLDKGFASTYDWYLDHATAAVSRPSTAASALQSRVTRSIASVVTSPATVTLAPTACSNPRDALPLSDDPVGQPQSS